MKKEIRVVDQAKGIVRITSCDERWYARSTTDQVTGLPVYQYVPSVTWIAEHYPKGIGFYKWLANTGWDEAEALKEAAGDKGSKVHQAISHLLDGNTVPMDGMVTNPTTGQAEPLTLEEYDALRAFAAWHTAAQPILVEKDIVVWNDAHGYAGPRRPLRRRRQPCPPRIPPRSPALRRSVSAGSTSTWPVSRRRR